MSDPTTSVWQQHYPTYSYGNRDIVLAEYEAAARAAAAEEKLFLTSGNVAFVVAAGLSSLALGRINALYQALAPLLPPGVVFTLLASLVLLFSGLTLKHFAERQKAIQFAKRKMVVLRSMLGLDYGHLQLVLPNWRLEGATQPFAIRLFPGWGTYATYPFWVIGFFSAVLLLLLTGNYVLLLHDDSLSPIAVATATALGWLLILAAVYRGSLYDTHERPLLSFAATLASLLRVRLVDSPEYTLYRARLAAFELERISFDTQSAERIAVFIEDRNFFSHRGLSIRGAARAARDYLARHRISGGSTISQQLARSLFIVDYQKILRRKFVEAVLTLWLEHVLDKPTILRLYLASVRFDKGVYGLSAAARRFLGHWLDRPSDGQAFVLIERIGNIRGRVLSNRVDQLLTQALTSNILAPVAACEAVREYKRLVAAELLSTVDQASFERLVAKWCP